MAEFVAFETISKDGKLPEDYGYMVISIYGIQSRSLLGVLPEEKNWIQENIEGKWSSWIFYDSMHDTAPVGQSFAFKLENDAMAFKLRWL